jgi:hypothetical protein
VISRLPSSAIAPRFTGEATGASFAPVTVQDTDAPAS